MVRARRSLPTSGPVRGQAGLVLRGLCTAGATTGAARVGVPRALSAAAPGGRVSDPVSVIRARAALAGRPAAAGASRLDAADGGRGGGGSSASYDALGVGDLHRSNCGAIVVELLQERQPRDGLNARQ